MKSDPYDFRGFLEDFQEFWNNAIFFLKNATGFGSRILGFFLDFV